MSFKSLKRWLSANERAKPVMWKNQSYVFFRGTVGEEAKAPMGVNGIPLQPGRSLAVDTTLLRPRNADLCRRARYHARDEVRRLSAPDDRAGCRFGHQGYGTRRHLFRLRRRSGPPGWHHEAAGPFLRAAAGSTAKRPRTEDRERTVKKPHGKGGRKGAGSAEDNDQKSGGRPRRRSSH